MDKYNLVKKPVVIEAIQYNGDWKQVREFVGKDGYYYQDGTELRIKTLEGEHICSVNDWIIKGVKGEFYPCKPDIFEMTYEKPKEVEPLNWQDILKIMLDTHEEFLPKNPPTHEDSELYMFRAKRIELLNVEEWISTKDKPLISQTALGWEVNEGISDEFWGALEVYNTKTGKYYWWMHHCIIKDRVGLCVVGEDDNEPSGWEIKDIEYYMPLPSPPKIIEAINKSRVEPLYNVVDEGKFYCCNIIQCSSQCEVCKEVDKKWNEHLNKEASEFLASIGYNNNSITATELWIAKEAVKKFQSSPNINKDK